MPKKNKALMLKKISILLSKLKKPVLPKMIISLKKLNSLRLMKADDIDSYSYYGYVKEYEFSPSNTPLMRFHRKSRKGRIIANFRKMYPNNVLSVSKCLNMGTETLTNNEHYVSSCQDEYCSVDERAEMFIQRFYEEMRRQRQDNYYILT